MNESKKFESLIIIGDTEGSKHYVQKLISSGTEPMEIINKHLMPSMKTIGTQFKDGKIFLPELMLATKACEAAMEVVEPYFKDGTKDHIVGKVVLGTVKSDLHDIGKNIFKSLLKANSFEVYDLGVDVPTIKFIQEAEQVGADVIALSALLTTCLPNQKDVIDYLVEKGVREKYAVIVGGAPVTQAWSEEIGADGYGENAELGVELAKKIIKEKKK